MFKNNYSVKNSLKKLFMQRYERYLPTAFDESMSLLEKMNKLIESQHQLIDAVNTHVEWTNEKLERAFDLIDDNLKQQLQLFRDELEEQKRLYEEIRDKVHSDLLPDTVRQKLEEWLISGTIAELINNTVFNEMIERLSDLENMTEFYPKDVRDFCAQGEDENDDTRALQEGLNHAVETGVKVNLNGQFKATKNIDGFMGTDRDVKQMFNGSGSITRGSDTFYLKPKGTQTNTIYVSGNNHHLNDGITRDKPVSFTTAVKFLAELSENSLDGHWKVKFIGEYNGRGFGNQELPYFKNPIVFEGELDENGKHLSVIDGQGIVDNYFFRADTGSGFEKMYTFKDLFFINWNKDISSAGAIVVWDNIDVLVQNCKTENCSRLVWARNGRLRAFDNETNGGHTAIGVQYHTSFNIERNKITGATSRGVHVGRNSAGHVRENVFDDCYINIEATQSSRLRTIENVHKNWGYRGVNVLLNATWEGMENEIIEYNFPRDKPFYETFYGSTVPVLQRGTELSRHAYSYKSQFLEITERKEYNLSEYFESPLRLPELMLMRENTHIKINLLVHSDAGGDSGLEFDLVLSKRQIDVGYLTIPIKTEKEMKGEIEINLYARQGSETNLCVVRYPDGGVVKSQYLSYRTHSQFTGGTNLMVSRFFLKNKKGVFSVLGLNTYISQ